VIIFIVIITLFYGFSENSILFFKDAGNPNLSKNNLEMRKNQKPNVKLKFIPDFTENPILITGK
jgi:hypothetical protein